MNQLEFTAKIEHGVIRLPKELENCENAIARVTITLESDEDKRAKKEKLFAAFEKLAKANPFAEIEDPVEWQRKLRDEWE